MTKPNSNIRHLICRLFIFFCFGLLPVVARSQTINFSQTRVRVREAIESIRQQANYSIDYPGKLISSKSTIKVKKKGNSVKQILDQLVGDSLSYSIQGRHIVITARRRDVNAHRAEMPARNTHPLKGLVLEEATGDPVIGATVSVNGKAAAVSDVNGEFNLQAVAPTSEITIASIGFKSHQLMAGDLATVTVKLKPSDDQLSEVVVVGAGTQKKISVTGSIANVRGDDLRAPSSSLTTNLAGKLAGIISSTTSGEPGSISEFYIRGISTFGGRSTPLILLDDIEISASDLNNLPAESIESFSILKDASATAIYGARGANGVMLITTKTGTENTKTRIKASVEMSYQHPMNRIEYVDGARWMEVYNEAQHARTPYAAPRYSDEAIELTRQGTSPYVYPNVDWYSLMFKNYNFNQRANVNMQGGGSRVSYYMGIQANHDTGQLKVPKTYSFDSNIDRWSYIFQSNIGYKPTTTTKVELHLNTQFGSQSGPGVSTSQLFSDVYNANPVAFPATFPSDGDSYIHFGNAILSGSKLRTNPYAEMMRSFSETHYTTVNTSLKINQQLDFLTKGLSVSTLVNLRSESNSSYTNNMKPYFYGILENALDPSDPTFYMTELLEKGTKYINQGTVYRNTDRTFYFDFRLNYNRRFGVHSVSGLLMYMQREYRREVLPNRNQGLSGRFTYDYDNKYLAEINFGYNGTERLAKGHRFELFPALSLGYVVSSEHFWKSLSKVVNHLKVRGSYGLVGSDETGSSAGAAHFLYRDNINVSGGNPFWVGLSKDNGVVKAGPVVYSYAVENPSWERARKLDVGLDMQFFYQLSLTVDYFREYRERILQKRQSWPMIMGYGSATPWSNIGKVDNQGVEISLKWSKELFKGFTVDFRGNFTYTKNKYRYKDEPDYPYVWQSQTGKPLSAIYGFVADGLFVSDDDIQASASQKNLNSTVLPGDIKYRDINNDGMITNEDQVMLSPYGSIPRIQYGIGLNFTYNKLDFGVFFNGSAKRSLMINNIAPFCSDDNNQDRNLMKWIADDYWTEEHTQAAYPRLGLTNSQIANNLVRSSFWLRCGNFLRFKSLEIGYTLPYCRVYFSGDNLFVWSPFKLWDPELQWNSYPLQRTLNMGVQFNF